MLFSTAVVSLFSIIVLLACVPRLKRRAKLKESNLDYPPGPTSFPLVGCFPTLLMYGTLTEFCKHIVKKYGPIFSSNLGAYRVVAFAELEIMRDALKHNNFQGRPNVPGLRVRSGGNYVGVTENEGKSWDEQRRYVVRTLKEFGIGKTSMESVVAKAVLEVCQYLKKRVGQPVNPQEVFGLALHNTLLKILTGKIVSLEDPELIAMYTEHCGGDKILFSDKLSAAYNLMPIFAKLFPRLSGFARIQSAFSVTHGKIKRIIEEHKETREPDNPRDFIDLYLNKIDETEDETSGFYGQQGENNLKATLADLFGGASETGNWTLSYAFLYVGHHSEVKRKLQEELDRVVGRSRIPQLDDRPNLPYCEATLMEVFRRNSLVHFGIPRSATQDTEFRGHFIAKDTILMPWIYGVHHDESYWGHNVNEFKPERFLIKEADSSWTLRKDKVVIPFGLGKRACPGELLGRMEMFIYFTTVMQQFDFHFEPNKPPPTMSPNEGIVLAPKKYNLIFTERY